MERSRRGVANKMFSPDGPTFLELVRQALSSTDGGYDLLASKFDSTPFRTPDDVTGRLRQVFDECKVEKAIDLCTGTGAGAEALAWVATERVVGIDRSSGMLEQARARVTSSARGASIGFHQRDALLPPQHLKPSKTGGIAPEAQSEEMDLAASTFDLATCFGAFGHIEYRHERRLVRNIRNYLVPGGRFIFVTTDPPKTLSAAHATARIFNAAMHLRNAVWRPQFIMYYLTFLLPRALELLDEEEFDIDVRRDFFPNYPQLILVVATRKLDLSAT